MNALAGSISKTAKAMRYGDLSEEEALKLVTWNPAVQLGIQQRVGSLEVGKDADLAIWNGHPLSVYARVDTTFVDGEIFFDRQQDLARRPELLKERAQLKPLNPIVRQQEEHLRKPRVGAGRRMLTTCGKEGNQP